MKINKNQEVSLEKRIEIYVAAGECITDVIEKLRQINEAGGKAYAIFNDGLLLSETADNEKIVKGLIMGKSITKPAGKFRNRLDIALAIIEEEHPEIFEILTTGTMKQNKVIDFDVNEIAVLPFKKEETKGIRFTKIKK